MEKIRLAAIFNVWDGDELLAGAIKCVYDHVNEVIIVWQDVSNFGEKYMPREVEIIISMQQKGVKGKITLVKFDPRVEIGGQMNERAKRNLGLDIARDKGCTHFIALDCDEYYEHFGTAKEMFLNSHHKGSVCKMRTYFKSPKFMFSEPENYYVPFIHELHQDTKSGSSSYKFYVDPTRAINQDDIIELPIFMHHFSWVRKDIMRKARNSSANVNNRLLRNEQIFTDYNSPDLEEGYLLKNWNRTITVVEDKFGILPILV
jgi:hypothetical protein